MSSSSDNKKARHGNDEGVDRISQLPEAIILHILSFLKIEDAVKTRFLSNRFAYSWSYLDRLEFVNSDPKFIEKTLFLHNRSNLHKFSFICQRYFPTFKFAHSWLQVLFWFCPLKDLTLKFNDYNGKRRLPQQFYSNSSIIRLNLLGCEISLNGSIKWESLRSLTISHTNFLPKCSMDDIFSGCPCLEFLELSNCKGFTKISLIDNKCFKKLVIRDYAEVNAMLEILAPTLESFVLSGSMKIIECKVVSSNCLKDCCLDFCLSYSNREDIAMYVLSSLLKDVCHVKDVITIGEWGLQVLCLIQRKRYGFPLSKFEVRCLKLYTKLTCEAKAGIKYLLRNLNCLEKLCITKREYNNEMWFQSENMCSGSNDMEAGFDLKLKTVEFIGFTLMNIKDELFFLVIFLLGIESCGQKMTLNLAN